MKVITWNMDYWKRNSEQRINAWDYLINVINPDISLLQEIVVLDNSLDEYSTLYHELDGKRKWGSAIISKYKINKELYIKGGYEGARGTVVAEVKQPNQEILTIINIYGQLDSDGYSTTTMHHILSDLTVLLDKNRNGNIILGGDLNVSIQLDIKNSRRFAAHKLVFDRLEDFGLIDCTKYFFNGNVQTHIHSKSVYPWQNDYLFLSKNLIEKVKICKVFKNDEIMELSDHLPVIIDIDL